MSKTTTPRAPRKSKKAAAPAAEIAVTETVIATAAPVIETPAPSTKLPSIRSIVLAGLLANRTTDQIIADVGAVHPTKQGFLKGKKHVGWYKVRVKQADTPEFKALAKMRADLAEAEEVLTA
jgi:hypothetical protein